MQWPDVRLHALGATIEAIEDVGDDCRVAFGKRCVEWDVSHVRSFMRQA
jgi:hypothetical protein